LQQCGVIQGSRLVGQGIVAIIGQWPAYVLEWEYSWSRSVEGSIEGDAVLVPRFTEIAVKAVCEALQCFAEKRKTMCRIFPLE